MQRDLSEQEMGGKIRNKSVLSESEWLDRFTKRESKQKTVVDSHTTF